ncbi:muramidase [Cordyceps javanica]|uniref:Muramidase n=1 Tax=Cordyceps javanica TaxID=43265 RepID=A0A545WE94_9HYPO|nr:muramidase [Cordyceps javanica]TQW12304.1 muramidase [Cordyceps javanica]
MLTSALLTFALAAGAGVTATPAGAGPATSTSTNTSIITGCRPRPTPAAALPDTYTLFRGDGSAQQGWPAVSDWGTFDQLWLANTALISIACSKHGWGADNSPAETAELRASIRAVAAKSGLGGGPGGGDGGGGVDERFVLATVMQESNGCVRAPTTHNGVRNPGLMQSHDGDGDCAAAEPCPAAEIALMIADGTLGTRSGDGLKQVLAKARNATAAAEAAATARPFYVAARLYNSGQADYDNLGDPKGATACYVSDIANRLTGWVFAESECRRPGVVP